MPDEGSHRCHTALRKLARPAGLEPATPGLEGRCSIHLSYGRTRAEAYRGETMLDTIAEDRHEALLEDVRASFDWAATA